MLKVLSTNQIRELDAYTIKHRPIASIDLMENACHAVFTWISERYPPNFKVGIVCGTGNNGGDGLGVARLLKDAGYDVSAWVVKGSVPESADFKINLERLSGKVSISYITDKVEPQIFSSVDILLDGLFGSGLSRPAEGVYAAVISQINDSSAEKIAIDIPSGLMADKPSEGTIVKADFTLSFQVPKLAFFFPQHHQFIGTWFLLDIGLHKEYLKQIETPHFYFLKKDVARLLKPRTKFDHKGKFGHALLIAGGYGKMGAAVLASRAALRSGLGLLTTYIPKCGYNIMQGSVPEAMTITDQHEMHLTAAPSLENYSVVGIGPGLGQGKETVQAFRKILEATQAPMVIDADALNILAASRELLQLVPPGSILTPHPKEFERIAGSWKNDFARLELQKQLAKNLKSVVVLKGAYTSIASPDGRVFFNSSGNPGMAKGGSGDVLTGILTGLLAQPYEALEAAQLGVFLHGYAGDLGAYEKGFSSLIASDIIEFLPEAFKRAV